MCELLKRSTRCKPNSLTQGKKKELLTASDADRQSEQVRGGGSVSPARTSSEQKACDVPGLGFLGYVVLLKKAQSKSKN